MTSSSPAAPIALLRAGDVLVARAAAGDIVARITHPIGQGGFGCVSAAICVSDGYGLALAPESNALALKAMLDHRDAMYEGACLQRLPRHPNIAPYYGIAKVLGHASSGPAPSFSVLVTRRGACNLRHFLMDGSIAGSFGHDHTEYSLVRLLTPVLDALMAAHKAGLCHSDIKLDNVVVNAGPDMDTVRAEIIDWGLAVSSSHLVVNHGAGTTHCQPPERALPSHIGCSYDPVKTDVYEFYYMLRDALTCLEAETGKQMSARMSFLLERGLELDPCHRHTPEQAMGDLLHYLRQTAPAGVGEMRIGEFIRLHTPLRVSDEEARSRVPMPGTDYDARRRAYEYVAGRHFADEFEATLVPREFLLREAPTPTATMAAAANTSPANSANRLPFCVVDMVDRLVGDLEASVFGDNRPRLLPSWSPPQAAHIPLQPWHEGAARHESRARVGARLGSVGNFPDSARAEVVGSGIGVAREDSDTRGMAARGGSDDGSADGWWRGDGGGDSDGQRAVHVFQEDEHLQWIRVLYGDVGETGASEAADDTDGPEQVAGECADAGSADGLNARSPASSETSLYIATGHDPPLGDAHPDTGDPSAEGRSVARSVASDGGWRACGDGDQGAVHAVRGDEHLWWIRTLYGETGEAGVPEVAGSVEVAEVQSGETASEMCERLESVPIQAPGTARRRSQRDAVHEGIGMVLLGVCAAAVVLPWLGRVCRVVLS